eukprot:CAMPEP_0176149218 /NCGR_PEP_ID=MMETSP0120_2-20121206/76128_1 /TAXON_ID=160619 /ORGANISM="Kryptoperidinium foliaceum, Strain CCMP 1326" /LENGTH=157 /DNA_ID=CAMNT_0017485989 /DNA_START=94 /DNA_END=564 /DNA_ORIENTATION=+
MLRRVSSSILGKSRHEMYQMHIFAPATLAGPLGTSVARLASRNLSDGVKGRLTNLFERGSKKASDAVKRQTDAALDTLEVKAKEASAKLSVEAKKAYKKGLASAEESEAAKSAASRTGRTMSKRSRAAADASSKRIRESSVGLMTSAQSIGTKAIKW